MVVRRFFCDTVENQGQIRVFRLVGLLSRPRRGSALEILPPTSRF